MTVLNDRWAYTRYGSPVVVLRLFEARTLPSRSTISPRTTFRAAAITAGLSGARDRSGERRTCQYPAPRAIPANATVSARPTWAIVWPSGFGRAGVRPLALIARPRRDPPHSSPGLARRRQRGPGAIGRLEPGHPAGQAGEAAARPRRRRRLDAAVGQGQEKSDDDPVDEQRGPAVADEREGDARQRDQLQVARGDDQRLGPDDECETGREQRPELVGRRRRDPEPALDDDEEQPEDRHHPDEAELLAERGQREVGVDRRDREIAADRRQTGAEPRAEQPAAGERVERLDDLVAVPGRALERVQPDVDAGLDGRDEVVHDERAGQEEHDADDDVPDPTGRRVQQAQEDGEEQERGAEVALDDDEPEGDRPHRDHRGEERQGRQGDRADLRRFLDEQRTVLGEVAGQEDDEDHLQELGRLAADR